jgi:hypothetical protein
MIWETNNKLQYKESVDEYEKRQKRLEEARLKEQQINRFNLVTSIQPIEEMKISIAGEPLVGIDKRGRTVLNKMRRIEENLNEIENTVSFIYFYLH